MIYTNSFFNEEVSRSFQSSRKHKWRVFVYALIISLVSFGVSFVFNSLNGTVFSEAFPSLTSSSNFAVLAVLNITVCLFIAFYLFSNYYTLTFAEINSNRMYMLVKYGENIKKIVLVRILISILFPLAIYVIAFIFCSLLSLLFSYTLSFSAFSGLLIMSSICFIGVVVLILTISLFFKTKKYALSIFILAMFLIVLYAFLGGFVNQATTASSLSNLWDIFGPKTSYFLFVIFGLIIGLFVICFLRANYLIKYYNTSYSKSDNIVVLDFVKEEPIKKPLISSTARNKIFTYTLYGIFMLIAASSVASNIYLLFMSNKTLTNVNSINQQVAVMFDSVTMTGDISRNDFVVFTTVPQEYEINTGDVIYYINDTHHPVVEKVKNIKEVEGEYVYVCDVNVYPSGTVEGSYLVELDRSRIKGVLSYRSRVLGAWFVFNESIAGKIVMIGGPLFIIAFYDRIKGIAKAYKKEDEDDIII